MAGFILLAYQWAGRGAGLNAFPDLTEAAAVRGGAGSRASWAGAGLDESDPRAHRAAAIRGGAGREQG